MKRHKHRESRTCSCYLLALEPDEECPVHGAGEWPPRCCECGRFMRRKRRHLSKMDSQPITNADKI